MKNIRLSQDVKRDMRLARLYHRLPKVEQYAEERSKEFPDEPMQVTYRKAIARIVDEAFDRAVKRLEAYNSDWNNHDNFVYNTADSLLYDYKTLTTSLCYAASTAYEKGYTYFVIDKKANVTYEPESHLHCLLKGDKDEAPRMQVSRYRRHMSHPLAVAARTYKWEHAKMLEDVMQRSKDHREQEQLTYRLNKILDDSKPERIYDNIRSTKKQRESYMEEKRKYNESRVFLDNLLADGNAPPEPMLKAMNNLVDHLRSRSILESGLWDRLGRKNKDLMSDLNNLLGDLIKAENRPDDIATVLNRLGEVRNIIALNGGGEEE